MYKQVIWMTFNTIIIFLISVWGLLGCTSSYSSNPPQISPVAEPCSPIKAANEKEILPDFLFEIHPAPSSVIRHKCYLESLEGLSLQVGVYVVVITEKMVEQNDNLTDLDDIDERIEIKINPTPKGDVTTHLGADLMVLEKYDEEGNVIATWAGPHVWKSFPAALPPGKHTVTVQVRKTSGEILEYSWTFSLEP